MHPDARRNGKPKQQRAHRLLVPAANPVVSEDELAHLAKDLAYFRAERFREVKFDDVREEDVRSAQVELAALIRRDQSA